MHQVFIGWRPYVLRRCTRTGWKPRVGRHKDCFYAKHSSQLGTENIVVRANDTDVLVRAVARDIKLGGVISKFADWCVLLFTITQNCSYADFRFFSIYWLNVTEKELLCEDVIEKVESNEDSSEEEPDVEDENCFWFWGLLGLFLLMKTNRDCFCWL